MSNLTNVIETIKANMLSTKLTNAQFREFVANTLFGLDPTCTECKKKDILIEAHEDNLKELSTIIKQMAG